MPPQRQTTHPLYATLAKTTDLATEKKAYFVKCEESCHKDVEWAFGEQCFAIVRYPALTWSESHMLEVMNGSVIMHNMIIESKRNTPADDDHPFDFVGPFAEVE
jgi:hypothetical protein